MTSGDSEGIDDDDPGAYGDEVLTDARGKPIPVESLYLEEASCYRPIATGDIFECEPQATILTDVQPCLLMVVSHPSGMRTGDLINEYVRVAPLVRDERLSRKKAATKMSDLFGLPRLEGFFHGGSPLDDGPWGARIDMAAPVGSSCLEIQRRRASLSIIGIRLLVQCVGNSDTRVMVREDTIERMLAPKLLEIEWLENWNDDLVRPRVEAGDDLVQALLAEAAEFEKVMEADRGDGQTLHTMISAVSGLSLVEAERIMTEELRGRRAAGRS